MTDTTAATLAKAAPINTIWLMARKYWLHWTTAELNAGETNVDVVLGPVPGDTTYRTYFTGAEGSPRVTNLDLATSPANQGAAALGAYPYKSLALGVPAPTLKPTVTSETQSTSPTKIIKTYDGSDISDWTVNFGDWSVSAAYGNPQPSFFGHAFNTRGSLFKNFGLTQDIESFRVEMDFQRLASSGTLDTVIGLFSSGDVLAGPHFVLPVPGNHSYSDGTGSSYAMANFDASILTHLLVTGTLNTTTDYFDMVATFSQASVTVSTISQRLKSTGSTFNLSMSCFGGGGQGDTNNFFDTLYFEFTPTPVPGEAPVYTNYVYTYVNQLLQESAPSPFAPSLVPTPSVPDKVTEPDEFTFNKITIPAIPGGADVIKVNLYRAVTSASGTNYLFVAAIDPPYPQAAPYEDKALSEELDEPLITEGHEAPPAGLRGLLALPNGILAGFTGSQLCLSEQNYPHAWPIVNRLTTDSPIVAIGAIDTTVLILTESHPYTAYGNDPAAFTMSKEEFSAGCQSKRSVAFLRGVGIVYASPDGITSYAGQGRLDIITRNMFTKEQWLALNPASIIGMVHDDRYFFWYQTLAGVKGGYILDARADGFGLVQLDFHATAVYVDNLTDTLYFCIDQGDAYDGASLVTPAGNAIVIWNAATALQPYQWRSKKYQLPAPTVFQMCQVKAFDYTSLTLKLYSNGTLYLTRAVTSVTEFVLPTPPTRTETFEFEVTGTSRVNQIEFVEDVSELA